MAGSLARGEIGGVSGGSDGDLKARLALAEERLDFYASFDRLIQDNVVQASRLMRDALELRERTQAELDLAKSQAEERFAAERSQYRLDLEAVHADLLALQATAASMARRVAATIGAMNATEDHAGAGARPALATAVTAAAVVGSTEAVLPVADGAAVGEADEAESAVEALAEELPAPRTASTPESISADAPQAIEAEPAVLGSGEEAQVAEREPAVAESQTEEVSGDGDAGFPVGVVELETGEPGPAEPALPPEPVVDAAPTWGKQVATAAAAVAETASPAQPEQPAEAPQPNEPGEDDAAGPRSVTVIVHGVPRAAAALALQRHLHGLTKVESVEAREYAEGVLRLHVVSGGRLGLEDLQGWEAGAGMEPVTVSRAVLEVKLPGAQGV